MKRLLYLIAFLPALAGATTPTISSVSGTISHGNTVTISGSNFLTITTTVYTTDNLDTGSFSANWFDHFDLTTSNTNQRSVNSTYHAVNDFTSQTFGQAKLQAGSTVSRDWYVSYWWYVGSDWDWGTTGYSGTDKWLANIKLFRLWNPGATLENFYVQYKGDQDQVQWIRESVGDDTPHGIINSARTALTKATWHKFEFQFRDTSALAAADGEFYMWMDAADKRVSATAQNFKLADNVYKRPYIVGWENEWGCTEDGGGGVDTLGCDGSNSFRMDDVFVQDTWARVQVGDNATYTSCTIREDQKVLSWADGSIQITYNQGQLGATPYLFVIDKNGAVSSGYSITVNGSVLPVRFSNMTLNNVRISGTQ